MKNYKIRTIAIDHYVGWEDVEASGIDIENMTDEEVEEEIEKIKSSLPQIVDFEVECEDESELDDIVCDTVSEITGWLNNSVDYIIVK